MQLVLVGGECQLLGKGCPAIGVRAALGAQSILPTALLRKPLHPSCLEPPELPSCASTLLSIKQSASVNRPPTAATTVSPSKC